MYTTNKWIPNGVRRTAADRVVVDDLAVSMEATSSWAWINAFLVHTSFVWTAFRAGNTFWTAVWRRTNVVIQTCAHSTLSTYTTHTVRSAWTGLTWVFRNRS